MHLAFVDFVYAYDAARPDEPEPLGGTTSAICFLARELVKAGIVCSLFNRVKLPCQAFGIQSRPLESLSDEVGRKDIDAYIFCGRWTEELVGLVRRHTQAPLIAWMHESAFVAPLTPALEAFDGVVFVSEWQMRVNQALVKPKWKLAVIRNAMNPIVAQSFGADESILAAKTQPPVLLFAGSFARGAFHIPPLLDKIRPHLSDFSVEMFCNQSPSGDAKQDAAYIEWLRSQPHITHIGMVGQQELAQRMRKASVMLAPNTWPETSCITMIEGLASGLSVITTTRAALPETASGFARLIPVDGPDERTRFDMPVDYDAFGDAVLEELRERNENSEETEVRLRRQVDFFHTHYQWGQRVGAWRKFIAAAGDKIPHQ